MSNTDDYADTLLIVDDEANVLSSLARLFRRDGYNLLRAESGFQALELLAEHEVGVIISDQRMPEMTGVQFFRKARELWPNTVRIMLSGYTELSSVTDSVNEGAISKFLTKPWDDEQLRDIVREAFKLYRVSRENARLNLALREANEALIYMNQDLELRVEKKTREAMRNLNVLRVAQDILAHLPIAVFGIDTDGCLAMVNHEAESLMAGSPGLLGSLAVDVLPNSLLVNDPDGQGNGYGHLADGRTVAFWRFELGTPTTPIGTALVIHHVGPENPL